MVRISPFSPKTIPVPSRSAPRLSAVRAFGTALMLSLTTASSVAVSAWKSETATWAARQVERAAAKKETVTVSGPERYLRAGPMVAGHLWRGNGSAGRWASAQRRNAVEGSPRGGADQAVGRYLTPRISISASPDGVAKVTTSPDFFFSSARAIG